MNKLDPVWNIFLTFLLILYFIVLASSLSAQSPCKKDICVVEFNAGWNEANRVDYLDELTDCGIKRISIDKGDWQKKYKIVVVPTIIVFNGEEVKRFQACLRFKMGATQEEVQAAIDELIMNKF